MRSHMHSYAVKLYIEKLELRRRTTGMVERCRIDPIIVGRHRGAAPRLVMQMKLQRQDGAILAGDATV